MTAGRADASSRTCRRMVAIDRAVFRKSIAVLIAGSIEPRFTSLAERASRSARENAAGSGSTTTPVDPRRK